MQMSRLARTAEVRQAFRRMGAIASRPRVCLDAARPALPSSFGARVATLLGYILFWGSASSAWVQAAEVEELGSPVHHVVVTLHKSRTSRSIVRSRRPSLARQKSRTYCR
jgi:hypothetical protein